MITKRLLYSARVVLVVCFELVFGIPYTEQNWRKEMLEIINTNLIYKYVFFFFQPKTYNTPRLWKSSWTPQKRCKPEATKAYTFVLTYVVLTLAWWYGVVERWSAWLLSRELGSRARVRKTSLSPTSSDGYLIHKLRKVNVAGHIISHTTILIHVMLKRKSFDNIYLKFRRLNF